MVAYPRIPGWFSSIVRQIDQEIFFSIVSVPSLNTIAIRFVNFPRRFRPFSSLLPLVAFYKKERKNN